jgi:type I restriction enzyme S subunit
MDSLQTYGGDSPAKLLVHPGELYLSLKDVTQSADLLGAVSRLPDDSLPGRLTQDTVKLEPKGAEVPLEYLYWLLRTPQYRTYCRAHATGTTNLGLAREDFLAFPAPEPTPTQLHIVETLGALDRKIELNRRMNETLEAMAQALFTSWFVDFDPVRASAEGCDPGLPFQIAALFPDTLVASVLGLVPRGWDVTTWGTIATLEYGKSLSGYGSATGGYPVYGTNGKIGTHSKPLCPYPGVIIGRKGAYRGVHYSASPFYAIDTAFYVAPKLPLELRWSYYDLLRRDINRMDSGSAIPSTSRGDFYSLPVVFPPVEVQRKFTALLEPIWERQDLNRSGSAVLRNLRDTLLPKLISGNLRLGNHSLSDSPPKEVGNDICTTS